MFVIGIVRGKPPSFLTTKTLVVKQSYWQNGGFRGGKMVVKRHYFASGRQKRKVDNATILQSYNKNHHTGKTKVVLHPVQVATCLTHVIPLLLPVLPTAWAPARR